MANFFEQFHDAPEQGAPAGTANYFSQFHPEDAGSVTPSGRIYVSPAKPKRPDNGVGDALVQGAKQGASAGFSDELQGLYAAGGGEEPDDPVVKGMKTVGKVIPGPIGTAAELGDPIFHTLAGFAKYLAQDPEAHEKYNAAVLRERERIKAAEEHHAIAKGIGEVGGAIATLPMGGEASQAAAWTARAIAAAKQGAVYGGLQGAGEGEGAADTVKRAAAGTVLGGVLGGVAAPLIEGAGKLLQKGTEKLRNTYRAAMDPDAEAARQYATAYRADRVDDPTFAQRMRPDEFRAAPEARLVDLGGGHMRRLADSAGIIAPGGEMKLKGMIDDRFKGQTNRFTDWFRSHFNYPDAYGQSQALDEVAKKVNGPAYKRVMDAHPVVNVPSEITQRPAVAQAMKDAVSLAQNYGEKMNGKPEINTILSGPGYHIADDVPTPGKTSLRYWDYVKKALDARINGAQRSGGIAELNSKQKADLGGLIDAKKALVAHLDSVASDYKAARQGAAGFFGADDALQAGIKYVSDSKVGLSEARATLAKMAPAERRLFQDGFVDEYLRAVINKTGDNRDVLLKIANNPEARGKLELVMGRDRMQVLESKIRVEQMFDQVRKAVQGQSITAKRLYDLGMAGGAGLSADGVYDTDPHKIAYGAIVGALSTGGKRINAQVAGRLVDMMLSRDPMVVEKGFKLISSDPKWLGALRDADTKIGRVISGTAPTGTALQLTGAVRADDQKPGVERPVGR